MRKRNVPALLLSAILAYSIGAIAAEEKIRVGSSPVVSSAGIYIAQNEGYFKAEGLEVEVVDIANSGAPMTVLLSSGQLDVGAGNLTAGLYSAVASGKGGKLVADKGHIEKDADYISLIVRADHLEAGRYKFMKDLKGFMLGLTALDGVSQQILTARFLDKAGIAEKDVKYVKLSYAEMNAALRTKSLDATVQLEPFVTQAELGGFAKSVGKGSEVYPGQQSAAIIYSIPFTKKRETAVKFMKAYLRGVRFYNRSLKDASAQKRVVEILKKHVKVDDAVWAKMSPVGLRADGRLDRTSVESDLKWYKDKGHTKTALTFTDVADESFVAEAVKFLDGK